MIRFESAAFRLGTAAPRREKVRFGFLLQLRVVKELQCELGLHIGLRENGRASLLKNVQAHKLRAFLGYIHVSNTTLSGLEALA
jgi:hypothetical protein